MKTLPWEQYEGSQALSLMFLTMLGMGLTPSAQAAFGATGVPFASGYGIADLEATKTPEEVAQLRADIKTRLQEIDSEYQGRTFDQPAQEEFASLQELQRQAQSRETEFVMRRQAVMEAAAGTGGLEAGAPTYARTHKKSNLPDNLHDLSEYRSRTSSEDAMVALMIDGAKKASELARYPHERATDENTKGNIHRLFETIDDPAALARHVLATGSRSYARAFGKVVSGHESMLTAEERAGIAVVGTTTAGGYAVPYTFDPTLVLTNDGSFSQLRQIARVEQIMGNTWKGLTSAGITVSRGVAEETAVTASSVTLGQPSATVQPVKAEIQFSIEADEDWTRLQAEMARVLQDAKDNEEATSFITGDGNAPNPGGIVGTFDAGSIVGSGLTVKLNDLDNLIASLPDRWEPRARFLGHRKVFTSLANLDRTAGATPNYQPLVAGEPTKLRDYPRHNASAMEKDISRTGYKVLIFGDFTQFLIVDRIGMSIELDPHVRDGDGKWTGQRALLAHWRNTSKILVPTAFRALVPGTAS